jgi:threonyl-tRNA synthetase
VFCREEDVLGELPRFIERLSRVYSDLGSRTMRWLCPLVRPHGLAPTNREWAEARLGDTVPRCGVAYSVQPGEGTFYVPKFKFALRDRYGRS